jgi:hypothetical protein
MQPTFLPQISRAGCYEIITTFVLAFAVIFTVAFVANPGINLLQTLQIVSGGLWVAEAAAM